MTVEEDAIGVARAFIDAFNAQDHEALAATLNYPHLRLANGRFRTIESAEDFVSLSRRSKPALQAEGWHHSVLVSIEVVQSGDDKVHLKLLVDRSREDGTAYNRFDTLWIATRQAGHWGITFRSSYLR